MQLPRFAVNSFFLLITMKFGTRERGRGDILFLNHESRILGHSSNPVCVFSTVEKVRQCGVWPTENWLSSSMNQIQGWTTVRESYSRALEQGPLREGGESECGRFLNRPSVSLARETRDSPDADGRTDNWPYERLKLVFSRSGWMLAENDIWVRPVCNFLANVNDTNNS